MAAPPRSGAAPRLLAVIVVTWVMSVLGGSRVVTCAACPDFAAAVNYAADAAPGAMAVGDLNGDGKLDVALATTLPNTVSILLGNGSGAFAAAVAYSAGASPSAVAIGDVNHDGKPDLAVTNFGSSTVSILLGNGDGTVGAPSAVAVPNDGVRTVAISDLNRDGKLDLAVANHGSTRVVSVLLGNGNGTFAAAVNHNTADAAGRAIAISDFNVDGNPDLAVAVDGTNKLLILLGNGAGGFGAAVGYGGAGPVGGIVVADVNRDGSVDVVVTTVNDSSGQVYINNGDGTFTPSAICCLGSGSVAMADVNGDGNQDLATANSLGSSIGVQLGNGHGVFGTATSYTTGNRPSALALADVNGDGKPDLLSANLFSEDVSVLLNSSVCSLNCGTIVPTSNYGVGITTPREVAVGDFNRDGKPDVAVANTGANAVAILMGNGNGSLAAAVNFSVGTEPRSVALGHFNRDGTLDLAVANRGSNSVSILIGQGNGAFAIPVNHNVGPAPASVALGDFNLDGKADLVTANGSGVPGSANNLSVLLGNGDGTFAAAVHYSDNGFEAFSVAVGDFNGDGKPDLVVANHALGQQSYSVLVGNGDGTFAAPQVYFDAGEGPMSIRIGDLNADGALDFALASGGIRIFLGRGDATFQLSGNYPAFAAESVELVDLNADGKLDLAVPNNFTHRRGVSTRFGNGAGGFGDPLEYDTGWVATWIAAGDVNGDGKVDLAVTSASNSSVGILLNTCPAPDLTVAKSHSGNFTQGQTGAAYTITVNNIGTGATNGTVTLVDTLPSGLVATAIGGTGWSCTLSSLTCTRSDALAAGSSYPSITLTVNVRSNSPNPQNNIAAVSGGNELNTGNNSVTDPTAVNQGFLVAPTSLSAMAASTSQVNLTWDAVHTAEGYQVLRSANNQPYTIVGSAVSTSFTDSSLAANATYLYQVRAVDGSGNIGPTSLADLATTMVLTDDPLVAQTTTIRAVHVDQLRAAVNAVRAAAGLPAATFTDAATAGIVIKVVHVTELRSALDEARAALGLPAIPYTGPVLSSGAAIKAAHVQELRSGVK
jgi:uncharacterized repeat protein (TIGR01451 family)